jgi:hypothetical protein
VAIMDGEDTIVSYLSSTFFRPGMEGSRLSMPFHCLHDRKLENQVIRLVNCSEDEWWL